MRSLYETLRDVKNSIPVLRDAYAWVRRITYPILHPRDRTYAGRLATETDIYRDATTIQELPPIYAYWSNKYLSPMLEEFGVSNPDQFFTKYLRESARNGGAESPVFLSVGAGNCETEIRVSQQLLEAGLTGFVIECLDVNRSMLQRGRAMAQTHGVASHIATVEGDFNTWKANRHYDAVIANQSLHHVVNLEGLFAEIARSLSPKGYFIIHDMIGRNGHQRWPEALVEVRRFWRELPPAYRHNRQLGRHEHMFKDWDCSSEGFEGIRAQDILPLLIERFGFRAFIGFANVIDIFIDRSFGPNFDAQGEWDRDFIDRVHALDEELLQDGTLTPTHMIAVLAAERDGPGIHSRGISPEAAVRRQLGRRRI